MKKIKESLKKTKKRITLGVNVAKGKIGESNVEASYTARGYQTKKIHKGGDFIVAGTNILTGRKMEPQMVEVKTGGATPSKQQRKMKKKWGSRYKVVRA